MKLLQPSAHENHLPWSWECCFVRPHLVISPSITVGVQKLILYKKLSTKREISKCRHLWITKKIYICSISRMTEGLAKDKKCPWSPVMTTARRRTSSYISSLVKRQQMPSSSRCLLSWQKKVTWASLCGQGGLIWGGSGPCTALITRSHRHAGRTHSHLGQRRIPGFIKRSTGKPCPLSERCKLL